MNRKSPASGSSTPPPPRPSRSPWQRFYAWALRRRRALARAQRLPRPVVSLGNLHWGGGGKTPMTDAVARHLRDLGLEVAVLSRGYSRDSRGPLVVSRGRGAEVDVQASGDEAALLARIENVSVVVAERRWQGGMLAMRELSPTPDLFLLDDGFSHVALHRDLEILLFPAADPFAGARLLPSGRLREPLEATQLADAIVLTGLDPSGSPHAHPALAALRRDLLPFGWTGPTFGAEFRVELGPTAATVRRALLVCGVARPGPVERSARRLADEHGFELVDSISFGDHHAYPDRSLERIRSASAGVDCVLTTGKDAVKLIGRLELGAGTELVEMEAAAQPDPELLRWLEDRLADLDVTSAEPGKRPRR